MREIDVAPWFYGAVFLYIAITGVRIWWRRNGQSMQADGVDDVNSYQDGDAGVMSNDDSDEPPSGPLSLQTDSRQTDRQAQTQGPSREKLLTFYAMLREAGISRERARPVLKGVGLPLDNNLWAGAAPPESPEEPTILTPIAGRPTKASYYENEPELRYQEPPR